MASEKFDAVFEGFFIRAVNVFDSTPVGEFTIIDNSTASHLLNCSEKYNQASVSSFAYLILTSLIQMYVCAMFLYNFPFQKWMYRIKVHGATVLCQHLSLLSVLVVLFAEKDMK